MLSTRTDIKTPSLRRGGGVFKLSARHPLILPICISLIVGLTGCATAPAPIPEARQPTQPSAGINPQEAVIDPQTQRNFERALALMKNGKNSAAETVLLDIIHAHPELSGAHANLGILYLRLGRMAPAEQALNQAVRLNPQASYYNQLGILYRQIGRFDEARKAYEQSLQIDPNYSNGHLNIGILYDIYLRDTAKALHHYQRYQSLRSSEDKLVSKWIVDLKQRSQAAEKSPAAKVQG